MIKLINTKILYYQFFLKKVNDCRKIYKNIYKNYL
jgi:hypothetical protein